MPGIKPYDRTAAVNYARRWALRRNGAFFDFSALGGNCTSFVSQCIYAGSCQMNDTPDTGWYYRSPSDRAAAWTGVEYLFRFLTANRGPGPFAALCPPEEGRPGDVLQLADSQGRFYHSLLLTGFSPGGDILVCAHSLDALDRPLSTYSYAGLRCLHIEGVRYDGDAPGVCIFPLT